MDPEWSDRDPKVNVRRSIIGDAYDKMSREALALQAQGLNGRQIAFRLGAGRDSVYRALREAGKGRKAVANPVVRNKFGGK